jgi:hypothetical protein
MSLASRVTNLFSSGSTGGTGLEEGNETGLASDGLERGNRRMEDGILGATAFKPETMSPQTVEEEGRPPYLHVRFNGPSQRRR